MTYIDNKTSVTTTNTCPSTVIEEHPVAPSSSPSPYKRSLITPSVSKLGQNHQHNYHHWQTATGKDTSRMTIEIPRTYSEPTVPSMVTVSPTEDDNNAYHRFYPSSIPVGNENPRCPTPTANNNSLLSMSFSIFDPRHYVNKPATLAPSPSSSLKKPNRPPPFVGALRPLPLPPVLFKDKWTPKETAETSTASTTSSDAYHRNESSSNSSGSSLSSLLMFNHHENDSSYSELQHVQNSNEEAYPSHTVEDLSFWDDLEPVPFGHGLKQPQTSTVTEVRQHHQPAQERRRKPITTTTTPALHSLLEDTLNEVLSMDVSIPCPSKVSTSQARSSKPQDSSKTSTSTSSSTETYQASSNVCVVPSNKREAPYYAAAPPPSTAIGQQQEHPRTSHQTMVTPVSHIDHRPVKRIKYGELQNPSAHPIYPNLNYQQQQQSPQNPASIPSMQPSKMMSSAPTVVSSSSSNNSGSDNKSKNGNNSNGSKHRFRDYQAEQWSYKFEELLTFKKKHGHCCVPHTFEANPPLARWVKRQRYQYKLLTETKEAAAVASPPTTSGVSKKKVDDSNKVSTLTEERVQLLENIGFVWDSHSAAWKERLKDLQLFKSIHGHCNVPSNHKLQPQLATWVKCQRRQFKLYSEGKASNMNQQRIQDLEQLGFQWKLRP